MALEGAAWLCMVLACLSDEVTIAMAPLPVAYAFFIHREYRTPRKLAVRALAYGAIVLALLPLQFMFTPDDEPRLALYGIGWHMPDQAWSRLPASWRCRWRTRTRWTCRRSGCRTPVGGRRGLARGTRPLPSRGFGQGAISRTVGDGGARAVHRFGTWRSWRRATSTWRRRLRDAGRGPCVRGDRDDSTFSAGQIRLRGRSRRGPDRRGGVRVDADAGA